MKYIICKRIMMIISTGHRNRSSIQTRLEANQVIYDQHLKMALSKAISICLIASNFFESAQPF